MARAAFRKDIQALRALAVTLVVIHHFWTSRLHGGYIGVDVFFVISGFLITSHLSRELENTGRVRLATFYARRVRRLLPAAFAVLIAGSLLVWLFVPFSAWERTAREVTAAAFYAENWVLAASAVDYSASQNDATIAQHYWSLSVEEQFYLLWPLLLWGFVALWRRVDAPVMAKAGIRDELGPKRATTIGIAGALLLVGLVSFPLSVWWVANSRQSAYFVTQARLWEFAVGAAVALLPRLIAGRALPAAPTAAVQWILSIGGWSVLAWAALTYSADTPFPGAAAAAPVLATAAIIAAGCLRTPPAPLEAAYGLKPVQWMGDVSYSVYLWHWPLVVVAPYVLGTEHPSLRNLGLYALTLILAWASYRWIEPAGQRLRPAAAPWKALTAMAVGMALIAGMGAVQARQGQQRSAEAAAQQESLQATGCTGPLALVNRAECADKVSQPVAVTAMADVNRYFVSDPICQTNKEPGAGAGERVCDFSEGRKNPHVAYIAGDSHAQHWQGGLIEVAKRQKWKLYYTYFGGCPLADVPYIGYTQLAPDGGASCRAKSKALSERILALKPDRVLYSVYARGEKVQTTGGESQLDVWTKGLPVFWKAWAAAGIQVDIMADPPLNGEVRDTKCLTVNAQNPSACATDRAQALGTDPMRAAFKTVRDPKIRLIDTTDAFCDEKSCYAGVGGVAVYYNQDHLNREYVRLMWPYLTKLLTSTE